MPTPADATHDLDALTGLPAPDIRLVVSDMDGTLLDAEHHLPADLWPLVDDLADRGIAFSPASGRHHVSLRTIFAERHEDMTYIASNGAHVLLGDRELHSDCLDPHLAAEVVGIIRTLPDARAVLLAKRGAYLERADETAFGWITDYVPPVTVVDDIVEAVSMVVERGDEVLSVGIFDNRSAEEHSLVALAGLRDRLTVQATHPTWVDVVSPTADKGTALRALQARLGVGPDQTLAFGDFLNDLPMFAAVTHSVAMANAHPEVRRRARWTAPSHDANGVVRTIRAFLDLPG
jgi:Cof subfamily protein (haloacid dehalogenase superfamily)